MSRWRFWPGYACGAQGPVAGVAWGQDPRSVQGCQPGPLPPESSASMASCVALPTRGTLYTLACLVRAGPQASPCGPKATLGLSSYRQQGPGALVSPKGARAAGPVLSSPPVPRRAAPAQPQPAEAEWQLPGLPEVSAPVVSAWGGGVGPGIPLSLALTPTPGPAEADALCLEPAGWLGLVTAGCMVLRSAH